MRNTRFLGQVVLGTAFVSLGLWCFSVFRADLRSIRQEEFILSVPERLPLLVISPSRREASVTVLLIHGLSGNKRVLWFFGSRLAQAGYRCLLVDLPGHGDSTERFDPSRVGGILDRGFRELMRRGLLDLPRTAVLGHSMGGLLGLNLGYQYPEIACTIALSPVLTLVDRERPRNLLLLEGDMDLTLVRRSVALLWDLSAGRGSPKDAGDRTESGDVGSGSGRRRATLPGTTHTSILFQQSTVLETLRWLRRAFPQASSREHRPAPVAVPLAFLAWSLAAFYGLLRLVDRHLPKKRALPPSSTRSRRFRWLAFTLASLSGTILMRPLADRGFIRLYLGSEVAVLFGATAAALAAFLSFDPVFPPRLHRTGISLATGPLLVLAFFFSAGLLVDRYWLHVVPGPSRVQYLPIFLLFLFPFFYFLEGFIEQPEGRGPRAKFFLRHVLHQGVLWTACIPAVLWWDAPYLLLLILPGLGIFSLLVSAYASALEDPLLRATFASGMFAWLFSAILVRI